MLVGNIKIKRVLHTITCMMFTVTNKNKSMKNKEFRPLTIEQLKDKEKRVKNSLKSEIISLIVFMGIFFYDHRENQLSVLFNFVKENAILIGAILMVVLALRDFKELREIKQVINKN